MKDDRGQALVLAVLALGIAAATIVGLRAAQDRILADVRERRAGEAAVEAAGAALADAEMALRRSPRDAGTPPRTRPSRAELEGLLADPLVGDRLLQAANTLAAANGGGSVSDISVRIAGGSLEIALLLGKHRHRVSIDGRCCRP